MLLWFVILFALISLLVTGIILTHRSYTYDEAGFALGMVSALFLLFFVLGSILWRNHNSDSLRFFKECSNKMIVLQYCVDNGDIKSAAPLIVDIVNANTWLEDAKKSNKKFYEVMIPDEVDNLEPYNIDFVLKKRVQVEKVP